MLTKKPIRWAGNSLSGVHCLHPYAAGIDSSTLPVTPKVDKDKENCTFSTSEQAMGGIIDQVYWSNFGLGGSLVVLV